MATIAKKLQFQYIKNGKREVLATTFNHMVHQIVYRYNKRNISEHDGLPKIIFVDPDDVRYSTIPEPYLPHKNAEAFVGELGGVWDRFQKDFEDLKLYQSLKNRFERGYPWEETVMYQSSVWGIENGLSTWNGCRTKSELNERCKSLDKLYIELAENGYSQSGVPIRKLEHSYADQTDQVIQVGDYLIPDESRVGIGRHGEYIRLGGGKHRVVLAKLLDIEKIPVVVLIKHTNVNRIC